MEGEVRQLWLPLTVDSWLSWWHTCISCFTATRQLIRDQENSICWKWRGAFLQDHRFEVKIFVKWYPLTTRCMELDSELFIRFEKKIVLCISLHLKLNWVHRDWNFLTKAFLEKWSFLHELFSILQSSKWSLLSLELVRVMFCCWYSYRQCIINFKSINHLVLGMGVDSLESFNSVFLLFLYL